MTTNFSSLKWIAKIAILWEITSVIYGIYYYYYLVNFYYIIILLFYVKKESVKPQVMRQSICWGKTKITSKPFLFCLSDLNPRLKSDQSHHKDHKLGSPTGGSSSVPHTPPRAQAADQACCPGMPRDRLKGVCRNSAWQLWESKATIKVRPK